jgi:hypothetical protein
MRMKIFLLCGIFILYEGGPNLSVVIKMFYIENLRRARIEANVKHRDHEEMKALSTDSAFYNRYREAILFNKNLVIPGACSLILAPLFAQMLFAQSI